MISKELKRLSRRELVDIIYQLKKNEQQMQEKIAALEEALQEKRIRVSVAGSIAEAAADITNLFSSPIDRRSVSARDCQYESRHRKGMRKNDRGRQSQGRTDHFRC